MPKIKLKNLDRSGANNEDVVTYKNAQGSWVGASGLLPVAPKQTITFVSGADIETIIVPSPAPGFLRFIGPMSAYSPVTEVQTGITIYNTFTSDLEAGIAISGTQITSSLMIDRMAIDNARWILPGTFGNAAGAYSAPGWYIPTFLSSSEALTFTPFLLGGLSYEALVQATYVDIPEESVIIKRTLLTTSYLDIIPPPPAGYVYVPLPPMDYFSENNNAASMLLSPTQFTNLNYPTASQHYPNIVVRHSTSLGAYDTFSGSLNFNSAATYFNGLSTLFLEGSTFNSLAAQNGAYPGLIAVGQSWQARLKTLEESDANTGTGSLAVATTVYWKLPVA